MELKTAIPFAFIKPNARLTWRDVLFGMEEELLAPGAAVDFAVEEVMASDKPSEAALELAGSGRVEPTKSLVERLASAEPRQDAASSAEK
jgi:hypothetical protein